jgi:hypothetical protein
MEASSMQLPTVKQSFDSETGCCCWNNLTALWPEGVVLIVPKLPVAYHDKRLKGLNLHNSVFHLYDLNKF